jgi:hypothetical protein
VFLLWCVLLLVVGRSRRVWRASAALQAQRDDDLDELVDPRAGAAAGVPDDEAPRGRKARPRDLDDGAPLYIPEEHARPVPARIRG